MSGDEVTQWYFPATLATPPVPETGYVVSKPGADDYKAGDKVRIRRFDTLEERDAAITAAFFESLSPSLEETR